MSLGQWSLCQKSRTRWRSRSRPRSRSLGRSLGCCSTIISILLSFSSFSFTYSFSSSSSPFNHLILLRNLFFAMARCRHRIIFILVIIIIIRSILVWFQSPTHFKGWVNIFEEFVMSGIWTGDLPISSRMLYLYATETYIEYSSILQVWYDFNFSWHLASDI